MNKMHPELKGIQEKELELRTLIAGSNKQELAQSLRLISMYVSLYKKQFGELPPDSYLPLLSSNTIDEHSARIFTGGLNEAIYMLDTVIRSNMEKEMLRNGQIALN